MARPLRYLPPDCPLVEVTCRTIHGRMLLRPSRELNQLVLGVLARAAHRYGVGVCAFVFLSNHCHLLLRPTSAHQLARFMNYLNSNIAREAGRLHRWREKFWGRRYRPVPVSSEPEAQIARLRYLLEQGCKEGLVGRPQDWPGATSVHALLADNTVTGAWVDRTAEYWARKRREEIEPGQFITVETLSLCPLPCWDKLSADEIRARIADLVSNIIAETRERLREANSRPLGARRIRRQNPHTQPLRISRSAAPRFHAATWPIRRSSRRATAATATPTATQSRLYGKSACRYGSRAMGFRRPVSVWSPRPEDDGTAAGPGSIPGLPGRTIR